MHLSKNQGILNTCPNGHFTKNVFKRISTNFKPNLNPNLHLTLIVTPKEQKRFWENEMTSFIG